MNKTVRIASFGAAVCLAAASLFACGNKTLITDTYTIIKESTDKALSIESGEILIYEISTADKNIEGHSLNGSTETYIRFTGTEDPDFDLTATIDDTLIGETTTYELVKDGETVIELVDGNGSFAPDADIPDIFETFRLDFTVSDIKNVEVTPTEKGIQLYKLTMSKDYANKFDTEADGVATDCTDVVLAYYIDAVKNLQKLVCEYTLTVTVDGTAVNVVKAVDAQIA